MSLEFDGKSFSKAIKTKRMIEMNVDMRKIKDDVGVHHSTLSRLEHGCVPSLKHFAALCDWLGFDIPFHKKLKKK